MVESMDDNVGKILDAIDRLGIADNTAIVFFSDNGGNMYNEVDGTTPTSNTPLRGGKATVYEGGTRVPCIISWPEVTQPATRSDDLIAKHRFLSDLPRFVRTGAAGPVRSSTESTCRDAPATASRLARRPSSLSFRTARWFRTTCHQR